MFRTNQEITEGWQVWRYGVDPIPEGLVRIKQGAWTSKTYGSEWSWHNDVRMYLPYDYTCTVHWSPNCEKFQDGELTFPDFLSAYGFWSQLCSNRTTAWIVDAFGNEDHFPQDRFNKDYGDDFLYGDDYDDDD